MLCESKGSTRSTHSHGCFFVCVDSALFLFLLRYSINSGCAIPRVQVSSSNQGEIHETFPDPGCSRGSHPKRHRGSANRGRPATADAKGQPGLSPAWSDYPINGLLTSSCIFSRKPKAPRRKIGAFVIFM